MKRISPRTIWIVAGAVAALAVAGGIAHATISQAGEMIHGCYQKGSGQLRVIDDASECKTSEVAISWNQSGPPGPAGAPATTRVTRITWNNSATGVIGTPTPQLIDTAGSFTKDEDATRLRLTWEGSVLVQAPNFQVCHFFLKIDAQRSQVESRSAVVTEFRIQDPVTLIDYFDGIPAGGHTVTIWAYSPTGDPLCSSNAGGWAETIFVEEMPT